MPSTIQSRIAAALWTDDRKTRIRLQHWSLTVAIYLASAAAMSVFTGDGIVSPRAILIWLAGTLSGLGVFHALMRSGWSERLQDPAMSQGQIVFGIFSVMAGYSVTNEARSSVLFPLIVILTFGAFSVPWRRMVELTLLALLALAGTMLGMHAVQPGRYSTVIDLSNFLLCTIVMPATSTVAMLLGSLRARLSRQRADLQAALARIQDLATRDELTGLANRRHAQALLEVEAQRNARAAQPFAIALIDLDHFKHLNDAHGHAGGDEMLRRFADEARACARGVDLVARWGGEEFLLLMPDTGEAAAVAAMERLRLRIAGAHATHDGVELSVTCSAGVAEHRAGHSTAQTLLRADRALYRAKAGGRNRVALAPHERAEAEAPVSFDVPPLKRTRGRSEVA